MAIKSFSVVTNYSALNEVTSKLNGANKHPAVKLRGMFFRTQDFESSAKQLMQQLHAEHALALRFIEIGYTSNDFRKEAQKTNVRLYTSSASSDGGGAFDTYDLGPALRHFLNDYCRILEPLLKLLAQKHTNVSAQNYHRPLEKVSFNSYIKRLENANINTPLDHDYFVNLYELWNNYKHAESSGAQAGGWSSDGMRITSEPKLYGSDIIYFKDMLVRDFIDKSLSSMNALLNHIV